MTWPPLASSRPISKRASVDFPAPLGPRASTSSPGSKETSIDSSTLVSPRFTVTDLASMRGMCLVFQQGARDYAQPP